MKFPLTAPLAALALLLVPALPAAAQQKPADRGDLANPESDFAESAPGNWPGTIARTKRGHLIGNPEAESRMIEFISYTCPHCATFANEGETGLELVLIAPGKMALEVRPVIRNPIDLAVSLLAACGDPAGFKGRHRMLMNRQDEWLGKARQAPRSQQEIWFRGDANARLNAASALGLVDMLAKAGMAPTDMNTCLKDDAAARQLLENGNADRTEFAVPGTPSFALDGKLLKDVHSWQALYPVLSARFGAAAPAQTGLLSRP